MKYMHYYCPIYDVYDAGYLITVFIIPHLLVMDTIIQIMTSKLTLYDNDDDDDDDDENTVRQ